MELVVAMVVSATLTAIAIPAYQAAIDKGQDQAGRQGIGEVARAVQARLTFERSRTISDAIVRTAIADVTRRPDSRDQEPVPWVPVGASASKTTDQVSFEVFTTPSGSQVALAVLSKSGACQLALVESVEQFTAWTAPSDQVSCVAAAARSGP